MITKSDNIAVTNGTQYYYNVSPKTRSVTINNLSGYYCFVRLGGVDAPKSARQADRIIPPRSMLQIPLQNALGLYFTNAPYGTVIISETEPDGIADVSYSTLIVTENSTIGGTAGVSSPADLKQFLPYGLAGTALGTPGLFPPINANGWLNFLCYIDASAAVLIDPQVRFNFSIAYNSIATTTYIQAVTDTLMGRGSMICIPLPFITQPNPAVLTGQFLITPELVGGSGRIAIFPVLTQVPLSPGNLGGTVQ